MRLISKLVIISVILIIGVLFATYSTGIFGNTSTSVSKENVNMSVYNVRFLQPFGTPLVFYRLPNGDYYTVVKLQASTNTSNIPASFPVPVRSLLLSSVKDNETGLYNLTYAVVIGKEWFEKIEQTGTIYLLGVNSNYTFYSVSVSNTPGKYDAIVEKKLGLKPANGNEAVNVPDNSVVLNDLSSLFYGAVVTTPPVVGNRTFDGVFFLSQPYSQPTTGLLEGYTLGTAQSDDWSMDFYFGTETEMTVKMPAYGNLTVLVAKPVSGEVLSISPDVTVTGNGTSLTITTGKGTFSTTIPAVLVFTPDGKVYSIVAGNEFEVGTFNGYGSTVGLTVYQPGVIVAFPKKNPLKISPDDISKLFSVVSKYEWGYYNASVSAFKDRTNAEYYSIFNPLGAVENETVFIPTVIASGKYYTETLYDAHASPEVLYLVSKNKGIPVDYISDYVVSPDGFKIQNVPTPKGIEPLKPTIVPAGSVRSVYFANATTIMSKLGWVLKSKHLFDEMTGYAVQSLYQGGTVGDYAVLTQFNVTGYEPIPIKWQWINRKVDSWDVFCCFVTIDVFADGIKVWIDQNPDRVVVKSDAGDEEEFEVYPYTIVIAHVSYDAGISCEFGLGFCDASCNNCNLKCPLFTLRGYIVKDLYTNLTAQNTVIYHEKIERMQDQPCFNADLRIGLMVIFVGEKTGDFPPYREYTDIGVQASWCDSELGIKAVFPEFLNKVLNNNFVKFNFKTASL